MDQSHPPLNFQPEDKLNYVSLINSEAAHIETSQQVAEKIESDAKQITNFFCKDGDSECKPKSRKRNPENWKQNVRKRNKNKGLEYVKVNGQVCEGKKLGPPCTCKEKCYLKIGSEACKKIFQNFWKLGDHSLQNAYIAGCVRIFLPKHCYKKNRVPSRRFFSRNFHVTVNGVDTEVCKQAFLNMHAISNGRLDRLLKKKQEIGNTGFDERGRHSNKVNKIPIEKIKLVHKHINSIREKAGYTSKKKPKKVEILPGALNIRTMYKAYKEEMTLKGLEPVCEYRYRKIFHTDFHLDFGKIASPTDSAQTQGRDLQQNQPQESHELTADAHSNLFYPQIKETQKIQANDKKGSNALEVGRETLNLDAQLDSNLKSAKQSVAYTQLEVQNGKEYEGGAVDSNSYILPQEVFRLDYPTVNYNNSQNWVFPTIG